MVDFTIVNAITTAMNPKPAVQRPPLDGDEPSGAPEARNSVVVGVGVIDEVVILEFRSPALRARR